MKIQDVSIPRGRFLVVRADGTTELVEQKPTLDLVRSAIGADTIDVVAVGRANRTDLVMIVDDDGWNSVPVERPYGIELVCTTPRRPLNGNATALYRAICHPGTTHQIAGDVAIAHDSDFGRSG